MSQPSQPDIETRLAEADLYFQHGLKENAEVIYRELLAHLPPDHSARAAIEQKIKAASPGAPAPAPSKFIYRP
jgi:cytochrome c-type biogenesis protein CcmH/NrfG